VFCFFPLLLDFFTHHGDIHFDISYYFVVANSIENRLKKYNIYRYVCADKEECRHKFRNKIGNGRKKRAKVREAGGKSPSYRIPLENEKKNALLPAIGSLVAAHNNIVDRPLPPMIKRAYVK